MLAHGQIGVGHETALRMALDQVPVHLDAFGLVATLVEVVPHREEHFVPAVIVLVLFQDDGIHVHGLLGVNLALSIVDLGFGCVGIGFALGEPCLNGFVVGLHLRVVDGAGFFVVTLSQSEKQIGLDRAVGRGLDDLTELADLVVQQLFFQGGARGLFLFDHG